MFELIALQMSFCDIPLKVFFDVDDTVFPKLHDNSFSVCRLQCRCPGQPPLTCNFRA